MKKITLLIFFTITLYLLKKSTPPHQTILNPRSSLTPSPSLPPPPSPKPSPITPPSPSLTPTPSPSSSPQPQFSPEEIHNFFVSFSNEYHLDVNILRHIAVCESGFNPQAQNLSYAGLFQFSQNTWTHYRNLQNLDPNPDLRLNAKEAIKTASYVLSINQAYIWPNCVPN